MSSNWAKLITPSRTSNFRVVTESADVVCKDKMASGCLHLLTQLEGDEGRKRPLDEL